MRCLLIGNYGVGNLGDEALREYFLIRFPEVEWIILSASPVGSAELPRLPLGLRSLVAPWWRTLAAYRRCDAVIFGGGSLFTDTESLFACLLWWWHAVVAWIFRKPIVLAFQGIGPFRTRLGERLARSVVGSAAFISVRDAQSAARASVWARVPVLLSTDPVFQRMAELRNPHPPLCVLGVIPRANSAEAFEEVVRSAVARIHPDVIRIISMQPDSDEERHVCLSLVGKFSSIASAHPVRTIPELAQVLGDCAHVVTERYHGALAALAIGIPVEIVAQREGDKLAALRAAQDRPGAIDALRARLRTGEEELRKFMNMIK